MCHRRRLQLGQRDGECWCRPVRGSVRHGQVEGVSRILMDDYTMFGCAMPYNANTKFACYWAQEFATGETEVSNSGAAPTPAPTVEVSTSAPTTSASETLATIVSGTETPEVPPCSVFRVV
ncbi:hypothetical protein PHYBOEH_007567 [Phytophthora boehmeriae]|uniref:Uncharacterized protein n=1 Tax=Phytophthora boehmeriae TaxID=109152 RepID=A0A8T1W5D7_9STRA|nr:hypothetical protein PHYBOEH_007567 [Phytophthora boehmeriae]